MSRWALKDKNGKYRSRRSFKQDYANDSEEPWEQQRQGKNKSNHVMNELNLFKKKKRSNNILDFGR